MTALRESPSSGRRIATFAVIGAVAFTIALTIDHVTHRAVQAPQAHREDWYRLLRVLGYVPTWLVVALAFLLTDRRRPRVEGAWWPARGLYLACSVIAAGLGSELLKLLIRRERPQGNGQYAFRSFMEDTLSTSGLGLPSGHAMVAFGGAFALARLLPASSGLWYAMAAGCALTRLLDGAHYLSDVTLAAIGGYAAAWALWAPFARRMRPREIGTRA